MSHKIVNSDQAPAPIGPYSQAVFANNTLYVSGQIAMDPATGQLIHTDIQSETRQVMKNMEAILTAAKLTFSDVVKCSIFVRNMDYFAAINEVYGSFFGEYAPARETVEVSRLPKNVNVEISCIAVA